jgi:hypothetical protein
LLLLVVVAEAIVWNIESQNHHRRALVIFDKGKGLPLIVMSPECRHEQYPSSAMLPQKKMDEFDVDSLVVESLSPSLQLQKDACHSAIKFRLERRLLPGRGIKGKPRRPKAPGKKAWDKGRSETE